MNLIASNGLKNIDYAEPYAGGAAVALALLFEEHAATIHINDLSRPVYAFWHAVLNDTADLCRRIRSVRVSMPEWHRQRAVYDRRETADLADLGFATLFLNRCNRSGIVGGGVIGGQEQSGEWGLDARFNKDELIARIRRIGRYRSRIHLYGLDALEFTKSVVRGLGPNSFTFFDPPYIENSEDLYLNVYDIKGHRALASRVASMKQPWVVTYDYAALESGLYPEHRRIVYGLSYSAQERYRGKEVMFLADGLRLPESWLRASGRVVLSHRKSRFPLVGRLEHAKPATRSRSTAPRPKTRRH